MSVTVLPVAASMYSAISADIVPFVGSFSAKFKEACSIQRGKQGGVSAKGTVSEPELWLSPADLTMELHRSLSAMAPFGEGNPEPVFGLRNVAFSDRRIPRATWWNHGGEAEGLRAKAALRFDVTFTLDVSDWGGEEPHLELRICEVGLSAV